MNTIGGIMSQKKILVLGPGSWGTALSQVLNDNGHDVRIWGNNPQQISEINTKHTNTLYFKDVVLHASKGLEQGTHERISTILEEEIPQKLRSEIVVVSGPSHAEETIVRDLTLITAASKRLEDAKYVQALFSNDYFRLYTNDDVIGVETAAALKNVIAVGAGALHGLGFGDNAKAAIITRGLAEITRLGVAMGANPDRKS